MALIDLTTDERLKLQKQLRDRRRARLFLTLTDVHVATPLDLDDPFVTVAVGGLYALRHASALLLGEDTLLTSRGDNVYEAIGPQDADTYSPIFYLGAGARIVLTPGNVGVVELYRVNPFFSRDTASASLIGETTP